MGRKKIAIKRISDTRRRHVTYSRRKVGLMKKAYELSVLTSCDIGLVMISEDGEKVTLYSSKPMENIIVKYNDIVTSNPSDVQQYFDNDMAKLVEDNNGNDDDMEEFSQSTTVANELDGQEEVKSSSATKRRKSTQKKPIKKRFSEDSSPNESVPTFMHPAGISHEDFVKLQAGGMVSSAGYFSGGNVSNNSFQYPPYYIFQPYAAPKDSESAPKVANDSTQSLVAIPQNQKQGGMVIGVSPMGSQNNLPSLPGMPPFAFVQHMMPDMSASTNSLMLMAQAASTTDLPSELSPAQTKQTNQTDQTIQTRQKSKK